MLSSHVLQRGLRLGLVVSLAFSLSACSFARRFDVQISGLAHPTLLGRGTTQPQYVLLPADPATKESDLQFIEFARSLEVALEQRGFVRVSEITPGTLAISLDYGIGEREIKTVYYPNSAFSRASFYRDYADYSYHRRRGGSRGHRHGRHCGHAGFDPAFAFRNHAYADTSTTHSYATYNRFLAIEARQIENERDLRSGTPIWSTKVESRGSVDDLRRVFPILLSAAIDYLGTDTGQRIETRIAEDDERVLTLQRALMPMAPPAPPSEGAVPSDDPRPG